MKELQKIFEHAYGITRLAESLPDDQRTDIMKYAFLIMQITENYLDEKDTDDNRETFRG